MKGKKRKKHRIVPVFLVLILLIFLAVLGVALRREYLPRPVESDFVEIAVPSGASTSQIASILQENGIVRYPRFFLLCSKLQGKDGQYREGYYQLRPSMGYEAIMKLLAGETPNTAESVVIVIPEGFELRQIAARVEESGLATQDEVIREAQVGEFPYLFLSSVPDRENRLEGYLFPDTYFFQKGDGAHEILNAMLKRFEEVYTPEYARRATDLGLSTDQVVTLASIIEREAVDEEDQKNVSSVFHNRLENDAFPYLQSCATVQYVLKERKPVLSEADTKIESPYNTYIHKGLPIGPIASPGKSSIEAALYPNDTDYLFFVLGRDGKHIYSKTYQEHLDAQQ